MAHFLILIISAIAAKLYLASLAIKKFDKEEVRKKIIKELKTYNFSHDKAEQIANSASAKIMEGELSLKSITKILNDVFVEFKQGSKNFITELPKKTRKIKKDVVEAFSDHFCVKKDVDNHDRKEGSQQAKKLDRSDAIIGKEVKVKRCDASEHNHKKFCVCKIIGKKVEILKKTQAVCGAEPLYLILDENKLVTRGEVILPRKKS